MNKDILSNLTSQSGISYRHSKTKGNTINGDVYKDSFLDTNIIFSYSNYTDSSEEIIKKCYLYVMNKQCKFIMCEAVLEELQEIIRKRFRIHKAVVNKIEKVDYSLEDSSLISKRDVPFAKQLYERFKDFELNKASFELSKERDLSKFAIDKFLENQVDEKVIPLEQIENDLVNRIHDIISNHADCKIIASALQLQKDREIFILVTADGKDLAPNGYEYLKEHFMINYPKENYKFPELNNLMFAN